MLGNKRVRKIIVFSSVFITIMMINFEYYQVQLLKIGFPIEFNGILYALFMIFMGNGAFLIHKFSPQVNKRYLFALIMAATSASYGIMGLSSSAVMLVIFMLFQQLVYGSGLLIIEDYLLNEVSDGNKKSTVLSMNSLIVSIYKVVILFMITIFLKYFSVDVFYVVLAFVNILVGLYFYRGIVVSKKETGVYK
jgi:membrane protein